MSTTSKYQDDDQEVNIDTSVLKKSVQAEVKEVDGILASQFITPPNNRTNTLPSNNNNKKQQQPPKRT